MQQLLIPEVGDEVEYFFTFDGDDEISGPFSAIVLAVDTTSKPFPTLDLRVCYPFDTGIVRAVPFKVGQRHWRALS